LWGLSQENLKRTLLPLGKFKKSEIKDIANKKGFKYLTDKRESYEICFVPDNEYRDFLISKAPNIASKFNNGNIISTDGRILGKHKGYPFYTIGQRKGLEVAAGVPLYVIRTIPDSNTVVLGSREELMSSKLKMKEFNLMKYSEIYNPIELLTKVRYKDPGTNGIVIYQNNSITIDFFKPVSAITPGQSAVFYEGIDLVGGGVIE
jgi:tRNA-specific 2-thiouridylase